MSSRLHITLSITALALMISANPVTARGPQKLVTTDQSQIAGRDLEDRLHAQHSRPRVSALLIP
jgi:hypothetical protein